MTVEGGCLCRQVRYTIDADPLTARSCWCRDCQYFGAGSATVNVFFPSDAVTMMGDLTLFESDADSGNRMQRGFCPRCGTQVTTGSTARPTVIGLRAGTLDDPSLFPPQSVIWTESAPHWAAIDKTIPKVSRQPA